MSMDLVKRFAKIVFRPTGKKFEVLSHLVFEHIELLVVCGNLGMRTPEIGIFEEASHNFVDKEGHFFLAAKSFEKGRFCGFWRIGLGLGWLCRCILVVFRRD